MVHYDSLGEYVKDPEGICQMLVARRSYLKQQMREDTARDKEVQASGQKVELSDHELIRRHHRAAWVSIQLQLYWVLFLGFSTQIAVKVALWEMSQGAGRQSASEIACLAALFQWLIFYTMLRMVTFQIVYTQSLVKDNLGMFVAIIISAIVVITSGSTLRQALLSMANYIRYFEDLPSP